MSDTELAVEPATPENNLVEKPVEVETPAESAPAKKDDASAIEKMQKRIDKLTWEKNEALRRENERLRAQVEIQSKPAPSETVVPTLEQHGYDDAKYQKALLEYVENFADRKVEERLSKKERESQVKQKVSSFEQKQTEFIKSKPDYAEKVLENDALKITVEMADVIRDSEFGPSVAYYLGENPEKAAAIAQLSPLAQARELGRIEAQFEAKAAPPSVSKAPAPVPKIEAVEFTPSNVKATDPASDKLSDSDWLQQRNKQLKKR